MSLPVSTFGIDCQQYPTILVTGDSISAGAFYKGGYAAELVSQYSCYADVLNRGLPGYNSTQLLRMVEETRAFTSNSAITIDLFIVHIGTNDSCMTGNQRVPLDLFQSNLVRIIAILRQHHPAAAIIFLSPAEVQQEHFMQWLKQAGWTGDYDARKSEYTQTFVDAMKDICAANGVGFIDCFRAFQEEVKGGTDLSTLLYDGLHYTPKGNEVVAKRLIATIIESLPHLSPLNLNHPYPFCLEYCHESEPDLLCSSKELELHFNTALAKKSILERYAQSLRARGYGSDMIDIPL